MHHARTRALLLVLLPLALAACAAGGPRDAGTASISGTMRLGNESPPALRVCAMPVAGGVSRCVHTAAGAASYRIEGLGAGRYHVVGWVRGGELRMLAHARTIRCIRAPCPPDTLIEVDVGHGAAVTGIDLAAAYTEVPAGWPQEPVG